MSADFEHFRLRLCAGLDMQQEVPEDKLAIVTAWRLFSPKAATNPEVARSSRAGRTTWNRAVAALRQPRGSFRCETLFTNAQTGSRGLRHREACGSP